jgi:hypothetical protein
MPMLPDPAATRAPGPVVFHRCADALQPDGHEAISKAALARTVADLLERPYGGDFDPLAAHVEQPYFVPSDTLILETQAQRLGIRNEHDLFGGVVPWPFAGTKAITHELPHPDACAPDGWSADFGRRVAEVVLPGFTAFTRADALQAGKRLLESGPVRLKRPAGVGGRGQALARDIRQLASELDAIDAGEMTRDGIVLECNLLDVRTFSVGQALLGPLLITYCGTQRLTRANDGRQVYGGSELLVARGGWEELLALELAPQTRIAVEQARIYHDAALAAFRGMFASRSNYDVAQGFDDAGVGRSGVLEQSWRIGGATGAELAALGAFKADQNLLSVGASTTECYGDCPELPDDAVVYYRGIDAQVGPLTKYARLHPHGDH